MVAEVKRLSMVIDAADVTKSAADFNPFYLRHVSTVRNVLFRMGLASDLDDAVQDCFIKAWRGLSGFSGGSSEKTWITRIAVNTALDFVRMRKRDILEFGPSEVVEVVSSDLNSIEASDVVMKALRVLKPDLRAVLVLSVMEGYSMEEISEMLAIPVGTVKSRLHNARKETELVLRSLGVKL